MNKTEILQQLHQYETSCKDEIAFRAQTIAFVTSYDDCCLRTNLVGHLTASAWIINREATRAVLIHHKKLDRWFQPGGHIEAEDTSIQEAARREGTEECGLAQLTSVSPRIYDIDVHTIPAKNDVPEHLHFDIRFVFCADDEAIHNPDLNEVSDMKWIGLSELLSGYFPRSITRMAEKMKNLTQ